MKIKKVALKNIRSFISAEFLFPDGSLLMAGDIGTGKTSLLLAIEYALFGLQPGQSGAALLRNNTDVGEVSLTLEIDGKEVIIQRRLKRGSKSITNEYASISVQGEKKECSITELKTHVLQLLGYPSEFLKKNNILYRYTVYTPQEHMKQIIIEDAETRLNILRHIFGIDKYRNIRDNALIIINYLKDEAKILQGEVKTLEADKSRYQSLQQDSENLLQKAAVKSEEFVQSKKQRKEKEHEVLKLEEQMKEKERFEKEIEKAQVLLSSKKEQITDIIKQISEVQRALSQSGPDFDEEAFKQVLSLIEEKKCSLDVMQHLQIELRSKLHAHDSLRQEQIGKRERVFQLEVCPTCLQDVPPSHKHNIMNAVEGKMVELDKIVISLQQQQEESKKQLETQKEALTYLQEKKVQLEIIKSNQVYQQLTKKKWGEQSRVREALEKDISLLEKHTQLLKQDMLRFTSLSNAGKIKQEELKQAFHAEKQVEIALAEINKEVEIAKKEMALLKEVMQKKELSKKRMHNLSELGDWLAGHFIALVNVTERNMMMRLRREFSHLFSKWFYMLAGESFTVHIDEHFTPIVLQGETEMDYMFLSGGERTAVALAYRLALNQIINLVLSTMKTKDIIILDEPTDGFSETQLERMREVLTELRVHQLFLVSHEQKMEGFVDNVIRLKKEEGVSRIASTTHTLTEALS